MSRSEELALDLPRGIKQAASGAVVDTAATHCFRFVSERWLSGAGSATKGTLMIVAGGFLLSQIPHTPNLVVQMAILGGLLIAGGLAFALYSLGDLFGSLTLDPKGYRVRLGLTGFSGNW